MISSQKESRMVFPALRRFRAEFGVMGRISPIPGCG
jgi:hypothetical protein